MIADIWIQYGMATLTFALLLAAWLTWRLPWVRERACRLAAEAMPAGLAYWVAVRVLNHAARTKFKATPAEQIKLLEALAEWHSSEVTTTRPARVATPRPAAAGSRAGEDVTDGPARRPI